MRLGLQVPNFTWPNGQGELGETFGLIAQRAEHAGLYSLWVMDHFFQIQTVGPAENEMLEGWSALAFAAGHTNHIKLGTMVTGVTYRYPGLLIKTATTLDVLSHGRAYFGVGAAWNEQEHAGLGVPFPPLGERFERLEEMLQIALQMWSGDEKAYEGKHYQLARPLNSPLSIQKPHPPILIGGTGERKTLRMVAQYGDACNIFLRLGKDEVKRKLDVLREHCDKLGRPYEQIEKTTLDTIRLSRDGRNGTLSPSAAIDHFAEQAAIGVDQAIFNSPDVTNLEFFDVLAQIAPEVEKIPVAGR
jgi:F420-dependent oxidoreductase-like protein